MGGDTEGDTVAPGMGWDTESGMKGTLGRFRLPDVENIFVFGTPSSIPAPFDNTREISPLGDGTRYLTLSHHRVTTTSYHDVHKRNVPYAFTTYGKQHIIGCPTITQHNNCQTPS